MNKVKVMIYGNEYTITGDRTVEEIKAIAANVNEKMKAAARGGADASPGSLAVLAALLISEEYTDDEKEIQKLRKEVDRLEEELEKAISQKEEAREKAQESSKEIESLKSENKVELETLRQQLKDYENNFFDLQMENIKLKSELEKNKDNQ